MMVLPTARKRRMFIDGKILIDCCAAIAWRNDPQEIAVQLHSKTFIHSAEHYFYHKDSTIKVASHDDLKNYRLALVRGYVYRNEHSFTEAARVGNIDEMLTLVALKRAEIGIVNPYDFTRRLEKRPLPLRLGGQHEASPLSIRIHVSLAHLLPRINAVIDRYLSEGLVESTLPDINFPKS